MTRRSSNESCDLYADVERSFHLRTMAESSLGASCKPSSRSSSTDRAGRHSPRRTRVGLDPLQSVDDGRMSPSVNLDANKKCNANVAAIVAVEPPECADYKYEVTPETEPTPPRPRAVPGPHNRSSSLREGMTHKTKLIDNSIERSVTRSVSPKRSTTSKAEPPAVQAESERPERSQRSKCRERYASERSERSQEISNSRKSIVSSPSERQRSDRPTDESDKRRRSSSRSRHEKRQLSQQALHRQSHTKSGSPNPSRKSTSPLETEKSVERQHRNNPSRQATGQLMKKGYVSRSAPDLRASEKHRKSENKRDKKKGERSSKEKKDSRVLKDKPALTTRSWRAQLAERFGRKPHSTPISNNAQRLYGRVPTTLICSDDFALDIRDDLTAIP